MSVTDVCWTLYETFGHYIRDWSLAYSFICLYKIWTRMLFHTYRVIQNHVFIVFISSFNYFQHATKKGTKDKRDEAKEASLMEIIDHGQAEG